MLVWPISVVDRLTEQFRLVPALEPVHEAEKVLAPWRNAICVVQEAGDDEQGIFVPVTVKVNGFKVSVVFDTSSGFILFILGNAESVVSMSRTFCT
jgi:hypothetical protein